MSNCGSIAAAAWRIRWKNVRPTGWLPRRSFVSPEGLKQLSVLRFADSGRRVLQSSQFCLFGVGQATVQLLGYQGQSPGIHLWNLPPALTGNADQVRDWVQWASQIFQLPCEPFAD